MAGEAQEVGGLKTGPQPVTPFFSDADTTRGAEGMELEAGSSWDPEPEPCSSHLCFSTATLCNRLKDQKVLSIHLILGKKLHTAASQNDLISLTGKETVRWFSLAYFDIIPAKSLYSLGLGNYRI